MLKKNKKQTYLRAAAYMLLLALVFSLSACSDDDDKSSTTAESFAQYVSQQQKDFLSKFDYTYVDKSLALIKDFRNRSVNYAFDSTGTSIRDRIYLNLNALTFFDFSAIPAILTDAQRIQGEFTADDATQRWVKTKEGSHYSILRFKDSNGEDCSISMTWDMTNASTIVITNLDGTKQNVLEPKTLNLKMTQSGEELLNLNLYFDCSLAEEKANLDAEIYMGSANINLVLKCDNERISLKRDLIKGSTTLQTASFVITGDSLFSSIVNPVRDISQAGDSAINSLISLSNAGADLNVFKIKSIEMSSSLMNAVNIQATCKDSKAALVGLLSYYLNPDRTADDAQKLVDVLNKNMDVTVSSLKYKDFKAIAAVQSDSKEGWDLVLNMEDGPLSLLNFTKNASIAPVISSMYGMIGKLTNLISTPSASQDGDGIVYTAPDGTTAKSRIYTCPDGTQCYIVDPSNWQNKLYNFEEAKALEKDGWYLIPTQGGSSFCEDRGTDKITYEQLLGLTMDLSDEANASSPLYSSYDEITYSSSFVNIFPLYGIYWTGTASEMDVKSAYIVKMQSKKYVTMNTYPLGILFYNRVRLVKPVE